MFLKLRFTVSFIDLYVYIYQYAHVHTHIYIYSMYIHTLINVLAWKNKGAQHKAN